VWQTSAYQHHISDYFTDKNAPGKDKSNRVSKTGQNLRTNNDAVWLQKFEPNKLQELIK
jgi:hypothetical protein